MPVDIFDGTSLRDTDFKDASPLQTVAHIRDILAQYSIETEEQWYSTGVPYCHALRLTVKGTTFGVNGKGLTKEFAIASAYGELMERLQFGFLGAPEMQKDSFDATSEMQRLKMSVEDLLAQNPHWYEAQSARLLRYTGQQVSAEDILRHFSEGDGTVKVAPFYNLTSHKKVYFPASLRCYQVYTANGCAAGNSPAEAIVQGISEIVERHHQLRILDERLTLPNIPDSFLQQFHAAWKIITYVRSRGYRVIIKDCSLGEKFPVIGAHIIGSNGKYHAHLGAHPNLEIALERALTESFQGRNIDNIAEFSNFIYLKDSSFGSIDVIQELTHSSGEREPGYFVNEPDFTFREDLGFTGANSQELLQQCIRFFTDKGMDVLIRDGSCLGFPTYQVLVPGYSEVFLQRLSPKLNDRRYGLAAQKALRNLPAATTDELLALIMHISLRSKLGSTNSKGHRFLSTTNLSAKLTTAQENSLMAAGMAYAHYALGQYSACAEYLQQLHSLPEMQKDGYLLCLKRYISMQINGYSAQHIRQLLDYFHLSEDVARLYGYLDSKKNPLTPYVLRCDLNCSADCKIYQSCCQKYTNTLAGILWEKIEAMDFDRFAAHMESLLPPL